MKRMIFLLAMSLFLPATVNAEDIDGNYHVLTPTGAIGSCGQYVAARDKARRGEYRDQNLHFSWMLGYITAYNYQTPDTYDVRGQTDTLGILLWLENYCKQTPLTDFTVAMELLTDELHPKRTRKAPK